MFIALKATFVSLWTINKCISNNRFYRSTFTCMMHYGHRRLPVICQTLHDIRIKD